GLRTGLEVGGLLEEVGHRRGLHHKSERLVLVIGDHDRNRRTLFHFLRGSVERLAEFHDVNAALTQGRTDRGRRIGRTCRYLELQLACNFLSHCFLPFYFAGNPAFSINAGKSGSRLAPAQLAGSSVVRKLTTG